jgi:hypothetical protein
MKKKLIGLATVSALVLSSQMASASEMASTQIVDSNISSSSSSYETASQKEISYMIEWNTFKNAEYYLVSLRDLKDDEPVLAFEQTYDTEYKFPYLKPHRNYRAWVGAYDSEGKLIGQGQKEFKTKETMDDKGGVIEYFVKLK